MLIFLLPAIFCDYFLLIHIYFIVRLSVYPRPCPDPLREFQTLRVQVLPSSEDSRS